MFVITESAKVQLKKQLNDSNAAAIQVAVKKSGCSGYRYYLDFCTELTDQFELLLEVPAHVVTLKETLPLLEGVTLDYQQEGLNHSFKFSNPDAKGECGCGESFML